LVSIHFVPEGVLTPTSFYSRADASKIFLGFGKVRDSLEQFEKARALECGRFFSLDYSGLLWISRDRSDYRAGLLLWTALTKPVLSLMLVEIGLAPPWALSAVTT